MARPRKKQQQKNEEIENLANEQAADDPGNEQIEDDKEKSEPVTFEPAGDAVLAVVSRVMQKYHSDMTDAGVTVFVEFAKAGKNSKGTKPAIMKNGHPQLGKIKRSDVHTRMQGAADLRLVLDQSAWETANAAKREATVDHYLSSIMLKREGNTETGEVKLDTQGRPVLKIKHFDTEVGIHDSVMRRHGLDMPGADKLAIVFDNWRQLDLPFDKTKGVAA